MGEMALVAVGKEREEVLPVLPSLATELVGLRKEAVDGRAAGGIEQKWQYAEDAYKGEDEAVQNRRKTYKPSGQDSGFIHVPPESWQRSIAFLNISRPFVDASAARAADGVNPTDERNWELEPTPKKDVESMLGMLSQLPPEDVETFRNELQLQIQEAEESVKAAQVQIDDWLTESHWHSCGTKCINDSARIGTGVVKGPVPMLVKGRIQPGSKVVRAQNCFPDPDCGDDHQNGEYFFEREEISARKLRKKVGMESAGWISSAVISCLEEGPKAYNGSALQLNGKPRKIYELWYYQGEVPVEALLECGCRVPSDAAPRIWANVTLCNDNIVRVSVAPMQEKFTYHVLNWQRRDGHWAGIGVAEQLETPQRGLNAAIRNLFDNAALSALPQIVHWEGILKPKNGRFEIAPGKLWKVNDEDRPISQIQHAIFTIEIPSRQKELMEIIALMRDLAQETTGLPWIMQGHSTTGTVGSDQMQTNAASTVLRRIAKEFDESITVPHIEAYYEWLKESGTVEVIEASVKARGSSILVERDIQAQALIEMVRLAGDPLYGQDPKLVMDEWLKSQKFDPRKTALSPERQEQLTAMLSQPDEKAQAQVQSAQLRADALTKQTVVEAETDRLELATSAEEAQRKRDHEKVMLDLKYKYEVVKYALERNIDIRTAVEELEKVEVPEAGNEGS